MTQPRRVHQDTLACQPADEIASLSRSLIPPIHLSSVHRIKDLDEVDAIYEGRGQGFVYARDGNENAEQLAEKLAALEGAEAGLICGSGMGAIATAFLASLGQGDHLVLSEGLYGKTVRLVEQELVRYGITHSVFDVTRPESLLKAMTPRTKLVLVETISNPLLRVADLPLLAELSHRQNAILVVDHTFAPLLCKPMEMGADVVLHSLTKLIGGHSDVILGGLVGSRAWIGRCRSLASTFGLSATGFESWLVQRGMATLAIRSNRACATALNLSERLARHPKIRAVHYPGLAGHPDRKRAGELLHGGFGTIFTIDVGGRDRANALIRALSTIPFAPSLGDVSTTLSHPATTSHRGQSAEKWSRQGITTGLIRFSTGLEDPDDLWADLDQALEAIAD